MALTKEQYEKLKEWIETVAFKHGYHQTDVYSKMKEKELDKLMFPEGEIE